MSNNLIDSKEVVKPIGSPLQRNISTNQIEGNEDHMDKLTRNELIQIAIDIIGKHAVTQKSNEVGRYSVNHTDYITMQDLELYLSGYDNNSELKHPSYFMHSMIKILNESGLVVVALDDNHFPPLIDKNYPIEIIQFTRLCLGAMYYEHKHSFTSVQIYELINRNIDEFVFLEPEFYEPAKIHPNVAERISEIIISLYSTNIL